MKISTTIALLFCLLGAQGGSAIAAPDPTQPPASWGASEELGVDGGGVLRLQSVLIPQRGRAIAVISGVTVPLGSQLGDAKLVRISEREAVLEGPDGITHLYLTPGIEKKMVYMPSPRKFKKAGKGEGSR